MSIFRVFELILPFLYEHQSEEGKDKLHNEDGPWIADSFISITVGNLHVFVEIVVRSFGASKTKTLSVDYHNIPIFLVLANKEVSVVLVFEWNDGFLYEMW